MSRGTIEDSKLQPRALQKKVTSLNDEVKELTSLEEQLHSIVDKKRALMAAQPRTISKVPSTTLKSYLTPTRIPCYRG